MKAFWWRFAGSGGVATAGDKKDKKYSNLHFSVIRAEKKVPDSER